MTPPDLPSRNHLDALGRRARELANQVSARTTGAVANVPRRLRISVPGTSSRGHGDAPAPTSPDPGRDAPEGCSPPEGGTGNGPSSPTRYSTSPTASPQAPRLTGTPFARTLATAFGSRPHSLGPGTRFFGSETPSHWLNLGLRVRERVLLAGYGACPDPDLDADVLGHVHGQLLMSLQGWPRGTGQRRHVFLSVPPTRLVQVRIPAEQEQAGALPWLRLCVDTDHSTRLLDVLGERHLDVVIAPVGRAPSEYAADLRLLLPEGLPAEVAAALQAAPWERTVRLHLLDRDRVAVDLAEKTLTVFDGVAHHGVASLTVTGGRVERAEVWLGQRRNWPLLPLLEGLTPP